MVCIGRSRDDGRARRRRLTVRAAQPDRWLSDRGQGEPGQPAGLVYFGGADVGAERSEYHSSPPTRTGSAAGTRDDNGKTIDNTAAGRTVVDKEEGWGTNVKSAGFPFRFHLRSSDLLILFHSLRRVLRESTGGNEENKSSTENRVTVPLRGPYALENTDENNDKISF